MKIPNNIRICGVTWRVEHTDLADDIADCIPNHHTIKVNHQFPQSVQELGFFHEIRHAVAYMAGIDDETKLTQEEFFKRTDYGLFCAIVDNNLFSGEYVGSTS